jgi:cbb3-type cytochrome oxidase subunit 3
MTRLSDVVSAAGLSGYAVVALLIFMFAFVLVVAAVFWPSRDGRHERAARLPFDDGAADPAAPATSEAAR